MTNENVAETNWPKLHPEFAVHTLNEEGKKMAVRIGCIFHNALTELEMVCPSGREMALVKTKMEEACFFAKKAMAKQNSTLL